jgi:3-deoxy-D-manno-octulosonic-acid transferase
MKCEIKLSFLERLILDMYGLLMRCLQPLLRRKLQSRGELEPGYLQHVPQRFGVYDTPVLSPGCVWVHAVSLGETRAAGLLIDALRQRLPFMRLLLTHSTATGMAQGLGLLKVGDIQAWLPWDTPQATRLFLQHHRPHFGILMETEIWPVLVNTCQQQCVPLFLVNARLNAQSLRSAQRWSWLARPAYRGLSGVLAQSKADADRFNAMGATVNGVLGNLKFDVQAQPHDQVRALLWREQWIHQGLPRPVVMLASTREGEEALWLDALAANPERLAVFQALGILWLLVPRHPQRCDDVYAQVRERGWSIFKRSALPEGGQAWPPVASHAQVWLGDSLGEMPLYFYAADMALLGGSFVSLGGQNLIEAAAFGCPIVMGPHTYNFAEASEQAQAVGAAKRVTDMDGALNQVLVWINDRAALASARQAGLDMVMNSRGAADHYAQTLLSLVSDHESQLGACKENT